MDTYYDYEVEAAYMPSDEDLEARRKMSCEYDWHIDAPKGWGCCVRCGDRYPYGCCSEAES